MNIINIVSSSTAQHNVCGTIVPLVWGIIWFNYIYFKDEFTAFFIGFSGYLISFFNIWFFLMLVFGGYHGANLSLSIYIYINSVSFSIFFCWLYLSSTWDQNTTHLNYDAEYLMKGRAFY